MTNNEKKLLAIFKKHGYSEQLKKLSEEVFELQEAILNYEFKDTLQAKQDMTLELADVAVILKEIMLNYNIDENDVSDFMRYKIDRQCERDDIDE